MFQATTIRGAEVNHLCPIIYNEARCTIFTNDTIYPVPLEVINFRALVSSQGDNSRSSKVYAIKCICSLSGEVHTYIEIKYCKLLKPGPSPALLTVAGILPLRKFLDSFRVNKLVAFPRFPGMFPVS